MPAGPALGENSDAIGVLDGAVIAEENARIAGDMALGERIDTETSDRMAADDEIRGHITTNAGNIMANEMAIGANADNISANAGSIAANMSSIGSNASAISDNRNRIGELSDDPAVVRAGVAAPMAPPHRYFALTGSNAALPSPVRRPVGSAARARPVRGVTLRACRPPCPMPQGGPSRRMPARALAQAGVFPVLDQAPHLRLAEDVRQRGDRPAVAHLYEGTGLGDRGQGDESLQAR